MNYKVKKIIQHLNKSTWDIIKNGKKIITLKHNNLLALIAANWAVMFNFSEKTILLFVEHWQWTWALAHARLSKISLKLNIIYV